MIVTKKATKSLAAMDGAVSTRWSEACRSNQPIVKTLVIPFPVDPSTIAIMAAGRAAASAGQPPALINSFDVQKVLRLVGANALLSHADCCAGRSSHHETMIIPNHVSANTDDSWHRFS
jgi:hypothetical protein